MLASWCHVDNFICNRRSEEIAIILPEWQELEEVWGHIVDRNPQENNQLLQKVFRIVDV
jgi:hypothetical protein